jgi:hypothetical protein
MGRLGMAGKLRRALVVALAVLIVAGPLAGTASAHHQEDGAFVLRIAGLEVEYYPEGDGYVLDAWGGYLLAVLCHVPSAECEDIEGEPPPSTVPLPDIPLPLPVPVPTPPR